MVGANAWRDLHHDALTLLVIRLLSQPQVVVSTRRVGRPAVRGLRAFELRVNDKPFDTYRGSLKSRNLSRFGRRPLVAESIADLARPRQARDQPPVHGEILRGIRPVLVTVERMIGRQAFRRAAVER